MKTYFDTSVLVAAAVESHPHHAAAAAAVRKAIAAPGQGHACTHGLAELYAVLTRLPVTPLIHPAEAWQIISRNILPFFTVITLSAREYESALRHCAEAGWTGGQIYDQLHIEAARKARCVRIYTFNLRHFQALAPDLAKRIHTP